MHVSDCKKMRPETGSVHPTTPSSCLGLLELVLLWAEAGTATPLLVHAGTLTPSPNLCPSFLPLPTPTHFLLQGDPKVGTALRGRGRRNKDGGGRTRVVVRGGGGSCAAGRGRGIAWNKDSRQRGSLWHHCGHDGGTATAEQGRPTVGDPDKDGRP